jgi:hypothetical protein
LAASGGPVWLLDRRRIELADAAVPGFPQPYHEGEPLAFEEAQKLVEGCIAASRRMAEQAFRAVLSDGWLRGHKVVGCGVLVRSGRALPGLAAVLGSHALIHTAEGEMFRDAVRYGAERNGLRVATIREREAYQDAAQVLGIPTDTLRERLEVMGRDAGPPWREDQKLATLAAWATLA